MTIKDLAAKTGYAVGTVSRALNDHPNVSDKARRAILAAAAESGFQLNQNAKQLKQHHSTTILVLVKGIGNELFSVMMESIQSALADTRYDLVVDYMDEASNEVTRAIQLCREKKPLGLLFLGGNAPNFTAEFSKIDIPCVLVTGDASGLDFPNLSSVTTDDFAAGEAAMDTLISQGHRRIAILGGCREESDISRLRYQGCIRSLERHGIPFDSSRAYRTVRFSYEGGYRATKELLESGLNFTALFAVADVVAIGAIRALRELGLRVPEDVSVMGMDGLPLGDYLVPQLSTVRQSAQAMARRSVEILLGSIEGGQRSTHETIPFTLKITESLLKIS